MKKLPLVSVIIPTYERCALLGYTLISLVRQKLHKELYEVIVVDDGSTDDTKEVVNSFKELLCITYLYQTDIGYRVASARNKGILEANGSLCIFVDSGVILDQNCIKTHIDFHRLKGPMVAGIGYVYGFEENDYLTDLLVDLIEPNEPTKSIKKLSKDNRFHDIRDSHYFRYNSNIADLPAPWLWFWTNHISVSKSNLLNVNLFDENYDSRWGVEDNDLGFRLHHSGVKLHILRNAKSVHYPHSKDKASRHLEGYINCQYFHKKFNTLETKIFLENYLEEDFVDINMLSLKIINKKISY